GGLAEELHEFWRGELLENARKRARQLLRVTRLDERDLDGVGRDSLDRPCPGIVLDVDVEIEESVFSPGAQRDAGPEAVPPNEPLGRFRSTEPWRAHGDQGIDFPFAYAGDVVSADESAEGVGQ